MRSYARNEESLFFGVVSNVSTLQFMVGVTYKMGVYAQRSCISFGFKFCSDITDSKMVRDRTVLRWRMEKEEEFEFKYGEDNFPSADKAWHMISSKESG